MSELPKTDSTAESQRITVPVNGRPQDHKPKIAFSTNILPGSNQYEFKPGWLHSTFLGGVKSERFSIVLQYSNVPVLKNKQRIKIVIYLKCLLLFFSSRGK